MMRRPEEFRKKNIGRIFLFDSMQKKKIIENI